MKKFRTFMGAIALAFMAPAVVTAQWSAFTAATPQNNGGEFWDNRSSDGEKCNIGYVLAGIAGAPNADRGTVCANQRPNGWLPLANGPVVTEQFGAARFNLFTSPLSFVEFTFFGDVAGLNQDWGIFEVVDGQRVKQSFNNVNVTCETILADGCAVSKGKLDKGVDGALWGLWINTGDGVTRFSDSDEQFAWFRDGGANYFGLEDLRQGDRDFNDVVFAATSAGGDLSVVPEPSTYALMATGLIGLGAFSRRRKKLA